MSKPVEVIIDFVTRLFKLKHLVELATEVARGFGPKKSLVYLEELLREVEDLVDILKKW